MLANNLKALVVILPLIFGVFFLARRIFEDTITTGQIDRWRNLFIAVTIIVFLTPNFWLMLLLLCLVVAAFGFSEPAKPALFLLLLCAIPPVLKFVPGFAGINNLMALSPQNVLALCVLVPCMINATKMRKQNDAGTATDIFFLLYALVVLALSFREVTVTHGLRLASLFFLQAVPVYYVFSRWPKNIDDHKVMTAAITIPVLALSAVALAEFALRWHFYAHPYSTWLGIQNEAYSLRGGFLRTYASIMGPIAFGYMIMVSLILSYPLLSKKVKKLWNRSGVGLFGVALMTTLSRGPWFGAVLGTCLYILSGPRGFVRMIQVGLIGVVLLILLLPTPFGGTVLSLLPFVGDAAGQTIDYRRDLLVIGWDVMLDNPLFGSENYNETEQMKQLVQGQGIIDIVNSYLRIGLESGLVGLGLFLGIHLSALYSLWVSMRRTRHELPEISEICRAYMAAYVAILFVLATTSSLSPIGIFNFVIAGLSVALHRIAVSELSAIRTTPAEAKVAPDEVDAIHTASAKPVWKEGAAAVTKKTVPKHLQQYLKN